MPKLSINDKNYYTEDFNEEQMSAYREIGVAQVEMQRMQYLCKLLDERCNQLGGYIASIAEKSKEETDETQTSE